MNDDIMHELQKCTDAIRDKFHEFIKECMKLKFDGISPERLINMVEIISMIETIALSVQEKNNQLLIAKLTQWTELITRHLTEAILATPETKIKIELSNLN